MRLLLRRFPILGGMHLFALLCAAMANANAATLTVTTTGDSGPGSLRQALADANNGDTILFDPALNGQAITLTTAELVIDTNVTIDGPGPNLLTVRRDQQASLFRIFHVMPGTIPVVSGLTITGGHVEDARGGGILNEGGTLRITNCSVHDNLCFGGGVNASGGGIYNASGTLNITQSSISDNGTLQAGGVFNGGQMQISDSTIIGNHAYQIGVGGGIGGGIVNNGTLTISDSVVSGNYAGEPNPFPTPAPSITPLPVGYGGGISTGGGNLTIQRSIITGNTATGFGGAGGGINGGGSLNITASTISNNHADNAGGGINAYGAVTITDSTISGNSGGNYGGGIDSYGPLIQNSTISANVAAYGSGIYIAYQGAGGRVTNCTMNDNGGSNILVFHSGIQIAHTILKATSGANIVNSGEGNVTSLGYNLSSDNGAGFLNGPGDQINTNPMLGPLQNNGGPTFTHALLPGSPAIDTGDPNFTPPPFTDQRGYPRVSNGRIDRGSFEVQIVPTPTPTPTPCMVLYDQTNTAGSGGVVSQNFEMVNNSYDAQAADDFVVPVMQNWLVQQVKVGGIYFNGPGPAASVNVTFYFDSANFPGAVVSGGTFNNLSMSDTAGSFTIPLPTSLVLTAGTYWVSVQANIDFNPFGEWAWSDRTAGSNSPAVWQNPGGGFATSCTTYGRRGANCGIDPAAPDQIFQILGCTVATTPITISGTVSYCSNPIPGPVQNVALTLSGSASGMSSSDATGNYTFLVPSGGSYTVTPSKAALPPASAGINTVDVIAVQRHFLNLGTPLSGCRLTAANVNGDSVVNTVDVIAIQRFYLGLTTGIANVGKHQFNPSSRTYPGVINNQTAQNYDTLVFGDVATPFVE